MVLRSLLLALVAVTASGCVMSSTHEALLKKHEAKIEEARSLTAALETANARITELEQERDALKSQIDQLQAEKARQLKDNSQLEASIQQMQQALSELEQRKREAEARIAEFRELLAPFGLDASDPRFWDQGLAMIGDLLDELEATDRAV